MYAKDITTHMYIFIPYIGFVYSTGGILTMNIPANYIDVAHTRFGS